MSHLYIFLAVGVFALGAALISAVLEENRRQKVRSRRDNRRSGSSCSSLRSWTSNDSAIEEKDNRPGSSCSSLRSWTSNDSAIEETTVVDRRQKVRKDSRHSIDSETEMRSYSQQLRKCQICSKETVLPELNCGHAVYCNTCIIERDLPKTHCLNCD